MWVTDAWRVLQAICQGEIRLTDKCHYIILLLSCFSPQSGNTALHWASVNGHFEVVKLLLQSHADVNDKNIVSTESPH